MKRYGLSILTIALVVIAFMAVPALQAQDSILKAETKQVPEAQLMDKEWVQDFEKADEGDYMQQNQVPVKALEQAIDAWKAEGYNYVPMIFKYDAEKGQLIQTIYLPGGQVLEMVPVCPPYC